MNAESTITADETASGIEPPPKKHLRKVLMLGGPAIVLVGALWFYLSGGRYESTDNASLQTGLVAISPSVPGKVISIEVRENQHVHKGDVLFRINPKGYRDTLAQAEADLAAARTDVGSLQADYREALSNVSAAQARYEFAVSEAARQKSLLAEGISSRSQYDEAATNARTARDAIAAEKAKAESLRAQLGERTSGSADLQPGVMRAASKLTQARSSLGDTIVRAPQDGIVTRVNQLQVGNYVQPGRPVFMLAGLRFWVQANFKENQLRYMRAGQTATIRIDAFPEHDLKGRLESFSPGTGSSFSVLPAENATGNWVKVVQRLPVQISIENAPRDLPLSAGLSATVEIDTGHQRHLFGPDTVTSTSATK